MIKTEEKAVFSVRVNKKLVKELKKLAVEQDKKYGELLEEAIKLLLEKYKNESSSRST